MRAIWEMYNSLAAQVLLVQVPSEKICEKYRNMHFNRYTMTSESQSQENTFKLSTQGLK